MTTEHKPQRMPWYWREHLIRVYELTGMDEWAEMLRRQRGR